MDSGKQSHFHAPPWLTPLALMHWACLGVLFTGVSWVAVWVCLAAYLVRVFALTAGFHRYFSHKAFRTSRAFQFLLALVGASAAQFDPLWWASHHRWHHRTADRVTDIHSPSQQGFWWAHIGWLLSNRYRGTDLSRVKDFAKFPELRWLNRHHYVMPVLLALFMFALGEALAAWRPAWQTNGWQMLVWGFFISTVLVYHATFSVNSFAHVFGKRRYETDDTSRNNRAVALFTMGEGWHNNHHRYALSARHGFFPHEIDLTYGLICLLEKLHVVWEVRHPPRAVYREGAL